jgi:hypothetical protein
VFFLRDELVFIIIAQKKKNFISSCKTANIQRKQRHFSQPQSSEEKDSTAMSGEDQQFQVISSKIIRAYRESFRIEGFSYFNIY